MLVETWRTQLQQNQVNLSHVNGTAVLRYRPRIGIVPYPYQMILTARRGLIVT